MTRKEVKALRGRELDQAIAEHVEGWTDIFWFEDDLERELCGIEPKRPGRRLVPYYTIDEDKAWALYLDLVKKVEYAIIIWELDHWDCYVSVKDYGGPCYSALGTTAAEAICRTCLLFTLHLDEGS